ncbi:MAG: hypothetical protein WBN31_12825 [Gammaproteobacteria bacterium]
MNIHNTRFGIAGCLCLLGAVSLTAACHSGAGTRDKITVQAADTADSAQSETARCSDLAAAEAVYVHYLFANNHSAIGADAAVVYIEFPGGADPAPGFFARISDFPVPTAPASHAITDEAGTLIEPASGRRALMLQIRSARLLGPGRAEIDGGYLEASQSGSQASYQMRCTNDGWTVVSTGPLKIS